MFPYPGDEARRLARRGGRSDSDTRRVHDAVAAAELIILRPLSDRQRRPELGIGGIRASLRRRGANCQGPRPACENKF
jgi:hypothetical protein